VSHTPGPWQHNGIDDDGDPYPPTVVWSGTTLICGPVGRIGIYVDPHPDEAGANFLLIAAAPDLLEALKTLSAEERRDDDDPVLLAARDKARAAIAKAEGK
jgi:hypothetical protein